MKNNIISVILVAAIMFLFSPVIMAEGQKEIFVSSVIGDDNGNGSKEKPYLTIDKAREQAYAGDTIKLLSGIYNSKIVFWENHYSKSSPLTIKGEQGENVIISAYDPINSEWQKYKDNIYRTNIGIRDDVSHALLYKNNQYSNLTEARWPNAPSNDLLNMQRATMDEGSNHYSLVDDSLPQGDWNGATAYLWTGKVYEQYVAYARTIQNYKSGESLDFSSYVGDSSDTYTPQKNDWYYLTNSLSGLDIENEYYYDKSDGYIYIIMPNNQMPQKGEVQIKTSSSAIELWSCDYINFQNLNIYGGVTVHDSNNCIFDNVNVYYSDFFRTNDGYNTHINSYNSTRFCGNNNTFKNSEIAYTMSSGLLINGNGNSVINCDIHDVAIGGGYNAAISIEGNTNNNLISHNNLYKSGRFLIYFINTGEFGNGYDNTIIEYNDCHNAMYLTSDGGAIYAYHRNGNGVTIRNNWVHDSVKNSCGIYLDNECYNFIVRNNVVWNVSEAGIVINNSSLNNIIYRNTVFDCGEGIQGWPKTSEYSQKGTLIANNAINPNAKFITGENAPTLITNAFSSEFNLNKYFVPNKDSVLIDKGTIISNIEDYHKGYSVDIGAYEFGGDYWIPGTYNKTIAGDINFDGKVNIKDILSLKKRLANIIETTNPEASDVNGDEVISIDDVLLLKKYVANFKVTLKKGK